MLIEVSVLQRFVLLLGHPVYSLTVTLFSLLLGTGLGASWSRRVPDESLPRAGAIAIASVAVIALLLVAIATPIVAWAIPFSRPVRIAISIVLLLPIGVVLGVPMPTGLRNLHQRYRPNGDQRTPGTRPRSRAPLDSRRRARSVRDRGLSTRFDSQDCRAHRIQPGRDLQLLPEQGRHLLCARGGRFPSAWRSCRRIGARTHAARSRSRDLLAHLRIQPRTAAVLRADVHGAVGAAHQPRVRALRGGADAETAGHRGYPGVHRFRRPAAIGETARGAARVDGRAAGNCGDAPLGAARSR